MTRHKINSLVLYLFLSFFILLSVAATYLNIVVEKNFKQFTADEEEPSALDFYIHPTDL